MSTWYPWNSLESLRREIDQTFENFGTRTSPRVRSVFLPGREARGYPLVNLYEDHEALRIEALAPGLEPADIHLTVLNNVSDFSVVLFRPHCMLVSEEHPMKVHKNQ